MNPLDAAPLVLLGSVLALAVIALTAAIESRQRPLPWDRAHGEMCDCGVRGASPYHVHPARPWVDRGPR